LEHLEQVNLFLLPLDDERHWYRYHRLFAEALRFRLTQAYPDLLPTLHQRASAWFEHHGYIPEAVNHALAANDFERAATLIEPILYPMFSHGTHATVRHWLQALPEEVLFTRPSLCLLYAWAFLYIGEIESCKRSLEVAEQAWRAEGNLSRLGEVYIFQSSIALVQGDAICARDYAQQALPLLAELDLVNRCTYATYTGASSLMLGNIREASRLLEEALNRCQAVHLYSTLYTMNFLAEMQIVQGGGNQPGSDQQIGRACKHP
jgi:LuxR family transcriptional regulator, maltose regulon positive regulatory protein